MTPDGRNHNNVITTVISGPAGIDSVTLRGNVRCSKYAIAIGTNRSHSKCVRHDNR
jgi:hypothetical protein